VLNPKNTFSSIKRVIGKSYNEITKKSEQLFIYKTNKKSLKDGKHNKNSQKNEEISYNEIFIDCPNLSRDVSPIEISSEILRNLLREATQYLGGEVITKGVITVPAYFLPHQCEATIKAGELDTLTLTLSLTNET
jgi:molecular chaperone DnaK